ncbi:hypothetical protein EOD41_19280 [Mucilaginibacter limnophilus]|uniref:Uncharacterized protein n=1 Tax=Mucilaginibacter limnophilus TaxID=1932778 RepID=A0A3S2WVW8_9SPHI|nr:hypothetical protein [Mucilaginibacter limnophilus]RVT97307.1 hypothetical protein EOD41_19280 [Mucilaginibacter limnophilus]
MSDTQLITILGQKLKLSMEKRRTRRIVDRKVKNEVSEEEKPLLTLIAKIIAEIAIVEINREEEMRDGSDSPNKTNSSIIKAKMKKI